jgi:hypothetical protein
MNTIFEHIIKGRASQAASLVETALKQKVLAALMTERKTVASDVYGRLDEAVSPGGNRPGTDPTIKPKHTGLQAPEGQKLKKPEQSVQQKTAHLQQDIVAQRKKAMTATAQAATSSNPSVNLADAKIAQSKMRAAQMKVAVVNKKN